MGVSTSTVESKRGGFGDVMMEDGDGNGEFIMIVQQVCFLLSYSLVVVVLALVCVCVVVGMLIWLVN